MKLALIASIVLAAASVSSATVVYNSLPAFTGTPIGVNSLGYAANSIAEGGDKINLAGTDRRLTTVTVGMADWSSFTDASNATFAGNVGVLGFNMPLTVNIYAPDTFVDSGTTYRTVADGAPLATKTINAFIPYKPAGYTALTGFNGYYFTLDVDMSDLNVTLPDSVVATVAYNTQTSGANPTGIAGPYNALNYALNTNVSVGSDDNVGDLYFGLNYQGDVYSPFAYDGYGARTTAIQINAVPEPTTLAALAGVAGVALRRRRA